MILGINPEYPDEWQIRIDGQQVGVIKRRRDKNGNTVYKLTAEEFREIMQKSLFPYKDAAD